MQPASTYFKPGTADRLLELLVRHTALSLSFGSPDSAVSIDSNQRSQPVCFDNYQSLPCVPSLQLGLLGTPQQAQALAAVEAARL